VAAFFVATALPWQGKRIGLSAWFYLIAVACLDANNRG